MFSVRDRVVARAIAAAIAALSAGVAAATYQYAVQTGSGQRFDAAAVNTVYAGPDARLAVLSVLGYVSIGAVVIAMIVSISLALARGHVRWAMGSVVVIVGANVSTQVLKHLLLDRPDFGLLTLNSLPSGHTTVVASATAATLLAAPPALRPVVVLGGAMATTLTATSTIVAGWHRPSDIVAALAVCLFWAAVASAGASRRVVWTRTTVPAAVIGAAAGVIALGVLGVRPTTGWGGVVDAALVLGALAATVSVFVAAVAVLAFDDDVSRETSHQDADVGSTVGVAGSSLTPDRPWS
ncbi:MAG: phosphatase PAP2 family protein [Aeromicrobium sp.]|uniref:phosphatase PAP2 family protein n=1 Tax=Aeromicrobium sp. TaxID=1871063 RepID=UPI003C54D82F